MVRNAGFAGKHCKIELDCEKGKIVGAHIQYWSTPVVSLEGNVVKIDMGNWRTRSTCQAANIFFSHINSNLRMVQRKWEYILVQQGVNGKEEQIASFGHKNDYSSTPKVCYDIKNKIEL